MNTAEQVIMIILASFLFLFLVSGIVVVVSIWRLTRKMNAVADKAQEIIGKAHDIADRVENVSDMFKKSAGPIALSRYFMNLAETVAKHKKGKK